MTIRLADATDFDELGRVMYDAVHRGRSLYSEAQRKAWVPQPRTGPAWEERLSAQDIFVEDEGDRISGFMSLASNGYVDFAYIRPAAQGTGLFRRLYDAVERRAVDEDQDRLWVHASLVAEPAFSAMGFSVVKKEVVEISGQSFERFEMEKPLGRR